MFSTSFKDLNEAIPEGIYETAISDVEDDGTKIIVSIEIRKDIPQDCQGRTLSHWMYRLREPKPIDQAVGGYSYNQLMRLGKAARLQEGKSYNSLSEYLADLVGHAVQVELHNEEYNGKKYLKVKYWNESTAPALSYRPDPPKPRQTQAATAYSQPTVQTAPAASELPWM